MGFLGFAISSTMCWHHNKQQGEPGTAVPDQFGGNHRVCQLPASVSIILSLWEMAR